VNRTALEGIIHGQIVLHEQVHDERVVHREELVTAIAGAIEAAKADETLAVPNLPTR
jgi:hypothetical protein